MSKLETREPTADECGSNALIAESDTQAAYAIWYPQMGGYVGKALAVIEKNSETCIDVRVWHDGNFPFDGENSEGKNPAELHHCDPEQFVEFGTLLQELIDKHTKKKEMVDSKLCEHRYFSANVNVNRLEPSQAGGIMQYNADITVRCVDCGTPFCFLGLPPGVDLKGATTSVDGCEGRFALAPQGEVGTILNNGSDLGFTIRVERP